MKIQCDVCEKAAATVICCADEAALCGRCDIQVHAANKLASKHQRLLLDSLSNKLPPCDICQEKAAFIFCVEDRALFCKDCDEPIHSPGTLSANHQRLLATGIRLASNSTTCSSLNNNPPLDLHPTPNHTSSAQPTHTQQTQTQTQTQTPPKLPIHHHQQHQLQPSSFGSAWAVDDLLRFSDFGSSPAKKELGEFEWLSDMGLFDDHHLNLAEEALAAGEVPQLPLSPPTVTITSFRPTTKSTMPYYKKPRIDIPYEDDELFMVPDIG